MMGWLELVGYVGGMDVEVEYYQQDDLRALLEATARS